MEGPTISDGELDILSTQSTGLVSSLASTLGDAVSGVPSRAPGTSNDCFYECASRDSDLSPSDVSDSPILRSPSGSNHGISVSDNETSDDLEITDTAAKFDDLAIAAFGQDGKSVDEGQSVEDYVSEEDYSDDNEEGATGYRKGGYHPVRIGEVYNGRYRVEEKLGWGHFSTVWLCLDLDAHNCVAMKVQKSASHYTEAALDEIELLNKLKMANPEHSSFTVELIDSFFHYGPNGKHMCMVFELLGQNLLSLIKKYDYRGIPVKMVKMITRDILKGLDYMHSECEIIHTDLKPENVLLTRTKPVDLELIRKNHASIEQEASLQAANASSESELLEIYIQQASKNGKKISKNQLAKLKLKAKTNFANRKIAPMLQSSTPPVSESGPLTDGSNVKLFYPQNESIIDGQKVCAKIADFGNACWTFRHFTEEIATRQYRPPEAIVGVPYSTTVDIWSLACMVFELLTGDYLFDPKADPENRFTRDEDHLALMTELLGRMPKIITSEGSRSREFFNRRGELRNINHLEFWPLKDVLLEKYRFSKEDAEMLSSFLLPMLYFNPEHRATAAQCLQHPWLSIQEDVNTYSDLISTHKSAFPRTAIDELVYPPPSLTTRSYST